MEKGIINKIYIGDDYYSITLDSGLGCGLDKSYGVVPKVGDELTVHGGWGERIRGMDLNGVRIYYKTDEQLEQERQEWLKKNEEDKQRKFLEGKESLDNDYNSLPDCFKKRIDRFRTNNPRFRVDYENYEMFCCTQAVEIANALKSSLKVQDFGKLEWEQQKMLVPNLSDGHSGNTFGMSVHLAYWYLEKPENVYKMHGSLSVLVGSEEYGDISKTAS